MKRLSLAASLVFAIAAVGCSSDNDDNVINTDVNGQIVAATTSGQQQGNSLATQAVADLNGTTDQVAIARSAGMIHAINDGEIAEAMVILNRANGTTTGTGSGSGTFGTTNASTPAADANAIAFANKMITDHTANNQMLDAMLASAGIAIQDSTTAATLRQQAAADVSNLQKASDVDLANTYLQLEIQDHQASLVLMNALVAMSSVNGVTNTTAVIVTGTSNGSGGVTGVVVTTTTLGHSGPYDTYLIQTRDLIQAHLNQAIALFRAGNTTVTTTTSG